MVHAFNRTKSRLLRYRGDTPVKTDRLHIGTLGHGELVPW